MYHSIARYAYVGYQFSQNWHVQLRHTQHKYDVDQAGQIAVSAYSFYDIAAEASSTTFHQAYNMAVNVGPVTAL